MIGNSWGKFIRTNNDTRDGCKFDTDRFLVSVSSRLPIPSFVNIVYKGMSFKVFFSIEDDPPFPATSLYPMNVKDKKSVSSNLGERSC